jgi:hypothetical protein
MMNNSENRNTEFESVLRNKMDELASSVDCFDKISEKAFPKSKSSFENGMYTIDEVENITGKKHRFRITPVITVAAVLILCLIFIPQNNQFINNVFSNVSKSDKQVFQDITDEVNRENEKYTYSVYDCTLYEYINRDILITPLFRCPFENSSVEGIRVRIFTKMCGDIPTNQVYVIEYEGDYDDGNYIAAAESSAKFTDEEYKTYSGLEKSDVSLPDISSISADSEENPVVAGVFEYESLFKYQDKIVVLNTETIYMHNTDDTENQNYSYDIHGTYTIGENSPEEFDTSLLENQWENVVYFGGESAAAVSYEGRCFTKTNISETDGDSMIIKPFDEYDEEDLPDIPNLNITIKAKDEVYGNILIPADTSLWGAYEIIITEDVSSWGSYQITTEDTDVIIEYGEDKEIEWEESETDDVDSNAFITDSDYSYFKF